MKKFAVLAMVISATMFASAVGNAPERLEGLFGMKFGKVMPPSESCVTNDEGALAFDYTPIKTFRDFTTYYIFATPLTRQVHRIRAAKHTDDTEAEVSGVVSALEAKFGIPVKDGITKNDKFVIFSNEDGNQINSMILITVSGQDVIIDGICFRLTKLALEEVAKIEEVLYKSDIKTLALKPEKRIGEKTIDRIDSAFGVVFGEKYPNEGVEQTNTGAWMNDIRPKGNFMGCSKFTTFSSVKTKKVFMVQAIYMGEDWRKRKQIRRIIESVTGQEMSKNADDNFYLCVGDCLISIEVIRNNMFALNIINTDLMGQHLIENKEVQQEKAASDLDAL